MGFLFRKRTEAYDEMTMMVVEAQLGDEIARERLLKEYTPFILRVASNFCNRYLVMGQDDEASIGLMAFNEAIDKYSADKGAKFLTFAEVVIRRRLTDYYRKESKFTNNVLPLSNFQDTENQDQERLLEIEEANKAFHIEEEAFNKKQEILQFTQMLGDFDISLSELVKLSPKHQDARERAYEVAKLIADNPLLLEFLQEKKTLPLKKIEEKVEVSRKTLERQRKYIIALVLVLTGNFEYLQSYIQGLEKEVKKG
ncbi:MAG: RNA polymerase sigma-I factor [Clostridia bacterium]|nr:RNA polymerase sigma-I factor [Clostridia bacterium]